MQQSLPSAKADTSGAATLVRTVRRIVTVRERGEVVVHRVRQVRTVFVANPAAAATTVHDTKTIRDTRTVAGTRTVVRTVAGRPVAPAKQAAPRVRTVTRTVVRTVTRTKTVPKQTVRVITLIEQQKPVTVTVTVTTPSP